MYAKDRVSLHEPIFVGKEKELLNQAIDSSFVSYQGASMTDFETELEVSLVKICGPSTRLNSLRFI